MSYTTEKLQKKDQIKRNQNTGVTFATWQDIQPIIALRILSTKAKAKVEKENQPKAEKERVKAKAEKEKRTKVEEGKEKATSQLTMFQKTGVCTLTQKKTTVQRKKLGFKRRGTFIV
jgi:hypothetical protein